MSISMQFYENTWEEPLLLEFNDTLQDTAARVPDNILGHSKITANICNNKPSVAPNLEKSG